MNKVQMAYAQAKARYDTLSTEALVATGPEPEDDEAVSAYVDRLIENEERLGVPAALRAKEHAEDAMIVWARDKVQNSPKTRRQWAANAEGLEHMFSVYKLHPNIHRKLVDISFRLA